MKRESLCMVTLPSSGSTWLAELIARHTRWNRYCMEFFNPLRNEQHHDVLVNYFGCELVSCYRNIASNGGGGVDAVIESTWGCENYNFTKEVFSPFKLAAFTRHFRCFVLLRETADTFPPKRLRVWSFYEHAWHAMNEYALNIGGRRPQERAILAHQWLTRHLRAEAERLQVPVIEYRELFCDRGLKEKLQAAVGECDTSLLDALRSSRVLIDR